MIHVLEGRQPHALGGAMVERLAGMAYDQAEVPVTGEDGPGLVLRRMVRFGGISLVRVGIPAGRALVETSGPSAKHTQLRSVAARVRMLHPDVQGEPLFVMASSRAVARLLAWFMGEEWDDAGHESLALAIAMPMPGICAALRDGTAADVAYQYRVDEMHVSTRARMLRVSHDSGQLHAVHAPTRLR